MKKNKNKRSWKLVLLFVLFWSYSIVSESNIHAVDSTAAMSVKLKMQTQSIRTGEEIRFSVDYAFSSLDYQYKDVRLEITIPNDVPDLTITPAKMPISYTSGEITQITPQVSGNKIVYEIPNNKQVVAGYASSIELVRIQTKRMTTLPRLTTVTATLYATSDQLLSTSDQANVNIQINPDWRVNKVAQFTTYSEGSYVRYRMRLQVQDVSGSLAAKAFTIEDAIPLGTTFVAFDSPSDPNIHLIHPNLISNQPATWNGAKAQPSTNNATKYPAGNVRYNNGIMTWEIPNSGAMYDGQCLLELTYWVKIDDDFLSNNPSGTVIKNKATLKATLLNDSLYQSESNAPISVIDSIGTIEIDPKKTNHFTNGGYGLDSEFVYFDIAASSFKNTSSIVDVTNYRIEDSASNYSEALTLYNIYIPGMNTGNDSSSFLNYTVEFFQDSNLLSTTNGSTSSARTILAPTGSNRYRITIPKIPRGSGGTGSTLSPIVVGFRLDASKTAVGECISNTANFKYTVLHDEYESNQSSGCQIIAEKGTAVVNVAKRIVNPISIYAFGDTIQFQISYSNHLYSGKSINNVLFYDVLPKGLQYIPDSSEGNVEVVEVINNFRNTGLQRITWKLKDPLTPNASGSFRFRVFVNEDARTLRFDNSIYMMSDTPLDVDFDKTSYPQDTLDINNNGNTSEAAIRSYTVFETVAYSGILVKKEVKGDADTEWLSYPTTGSVYTNGQLQYRITVKNMTSQPLRDVRLLDILPYVGDQGVIVDSARGSQWNPVLKAPVSTSDDINIAYATTNNPNRGMIGLPLLGEANTEWLSEAPLDITRVKSLKVEKLTPLGVQESFSFTFDVVVPSGVDVDQIAWNSVGMQARSDTGNQSVPVEPNKVGIKSMQSLKRTISGQAWFDANYNGIHDINEAGLNGIRVYLLDEQGNRIMKNGVVVDTITSTAMDGTKGMYQFTNLDAGVYQVEFEPIPTYGNTYAFDFDNPLSQNYSDYNPLTNKTTSIQLSDQDIQYIDGGFTLGSIGDFVFDDANYNGIQDVNEKGIANVLVDLYKDDVLVKTINTDINGKYTFTSLEQGSYQVRITKPAQYDLSPALQGDDRTLDSDFTILNATQVQVTIPALYDENGVSAPIDTMDCGFSASTASIQGKVWNDLNRDSVFSLKPFSILPEQLVSGVIIELYDSESNKVATTITDENGFYTFEHVSIGDYQLKIVLPQDSSLALYQKGINASIDSDFDPITNKTQILYIGHNSQVLNIDAGIKFKPNAKIEGHVYYDQDYDCRQSEIELDYDGFVVGLYDYDTDEMVTTTTTNEFGYYQFTNVPTGKYYVRFEDVKANEKIGNQQARIDATSSSLALSVEIEDIDTYKDNEPDGGVCIQSRESDIGDYVWLDSNRNGLQDSDEQGLAAVTVNLYEDQTLLATTHTNVDGYYTFTNLKTPRTYRLEFILPSDEYLYTAANVIDTSTQARGNSRAIVTENPQVASIDVNLEANHKAMFYDAGVTYAPSSIGDRIWFDQDQISLQNSNSLPLANITLHLYKVTDVETRIQTTISDENGNYQFNNLDPGIYYIQIDKNSIPAFLQLVATSMLDTNVNSDFDQASARTSNITIQANEKRLDIDAGFTYKPVTVGDYVWLDSNHNGIQDTNELPISQTHLHLLQKIDGKLVEISDTYSDPFGTYHLSVKQPYSYDGIMFTPNIFYVSIDHPNKMHISDKHHQGDNEQDNDFVYDGTLYLSDPITFSLDTYIASLNNIDAAIEYDFAAIGDYVWNDTNHNGIQDANEKGIENIKVQLYSKTGQLLFSTHTDQKGYYQFNDLDADEYCIQVELKKNYQFTLVNKGDHFSDNNFSKNQVCIAIEAGEYNQSIDAGMYLHDEDTNTKDTTHKQVYIALLLISVWVIIIQRRKQQPN